MSALIEVDIHRSSTGFEYWAVYLSMLSLAVLLSLCSDFQLLAAGGGTSGAIPQMLVLSLNHSSVCLCCKQEGVICAFLGIPSSPCTDAEGPESSFLRIAEVSMNSADTTRPRTSCPGVC